MPAVVAAEGLCKRFGEVEALRDVSFDFDGPRVIGILGPNGAGKTTLLDILEGLAEPDHGTVRLFGSAPAPYPRSRVGVVLQREMVLDRVTVAEYAELFAAIHGVRGGQARILAGAGLEGRTRVPVDRLSGGEAARLFIAAAVVHDPDLVLLDEPTARLDPESKRRVGAMLREMGRQRTVVLTTHDLHEADAVCDYLMFLVQGRVRGLGTPQELLEAVPEDQRSGTPVESAFFHHCAVRIDVGGDAR